VYCHAFIANFGEKVNTFFAIFSSFPGVFPGAADHFDFITLKRRGERWPTPPAIVAVAVNYLLAALAAFSLAALAILTRAIPTLAIFIAVAALVVTALATLAIVVPTVAIVVIATFAIVVASIVTATGRGIDNQIPRADGYGHDVQGIGRVATD